MAFNLLFPPKEEREATGTSPVKQPKKVKGAGKPRLQDKPRGCEVCPLNKIEGIVKILPVVDPAKKCMVVAQSPGPEENDEGKELIGRSGKFFWNELKKAGLERADCNVLNAVKCFPADLVKGSYSSHLKMRDPTTEEVRCCSVHTENALAEAKPRHILVLGQVAAKTLLGTRSLPQQKIFHSDALSAKIYLVDHPAYFIRGGVTNDTPSSSYPKLAAMRATLAILKKDVDSNSTEEWDAFGYLKEQKYYLVDNLKKAVTAGNNIQKYVKAGHRISVDVENYEEDGKTVIVCCGFSPKPGLSFVYLFHKPEVREIAKTLLEDSGIEKVMHWGCSDSSKLAETGIHVRGYVFDTLYGEYFSAPDQKKYGLEEVAELHFPEFSGYKTLPYLDILQGSVDVPSNVVGANASVQKAYIKKRKLFDIRKLTQDTLRLYNGADCDVTKRAELLTQNAGPAALMKLYVDLGFLLYQMEDNGPPFDYEQNQKLGVIYPHREKTKLAQLREIIGNPEYNPGSPKQVTTALYEKLGLEFPGEGKRNTRKETLLLLARQHPFPGLQLEVRRIQKAMGTYIEGYKKCAEANGGKLRTKWKSTGTATGRLSSGGDKDSVGLTNLQNIHNDPQIKNMLIADVRWRAAYEAVGKILQPYLKLKDPYAWLKKHGKLGKIRLAAEEWLETEMPDLETFLGFDFGQIEVRVAAQLSGDQQLLKDCLEADIHSTVGVTMTGWTADQIRSNKKIRTLTKNIHFGIIFGQSEDATVNYVMTITPAEDREGLSEDFIREGYRRYHQRYPGIRKFVDKQREIAREHGYVETIFGLRRPLVISEHKHGGEEEEDEDSFFLDEDSKRHSYWGNIAINSRVQGSAHQLMICAVVNLYRQPEKYKVLGIPTLEVHDFLGFRVKVRYLPEAYERGRYLLEKESLNTVKKDFPHIKWKVPIVTEAEAGLRLGCQVGLEDGFTVGDFLVRWYLKCRKQEEEIDADIMQVMTAEGQS